MTWYYYGLGFKKGPTEKKASHLAEINGCKFKVKPEKDPIGGRLFKVYFNCKKDIKDR